MFNSVFVSSVHVVLSAVYLHFKIPYDLLVLRQCSDHAAFQADVYTDSSGACAAFIANTNNKTDKIVEFRNASYHLPAWSVSILPDCKNVVFNTAKVIYSFLLSNEILHVLIFEASKNFSIRCL